MFLQLALICYLASAASSQDTYGAGTVAPWSGKAEEFDKLLTKDADAEGRYTLQGRDVSKPYTQSSLDPIPGWALTVSTKADMSMNGTNATFTGTRIELKVPNATDMHPTWQLCVLDWRVDQDNYPAAMREDDGTCSKAISQDCRRDVQAAVVKKYKASDEVTACACPSLSTIGSCGSEDAKKALYGGGACQARTFNATQIRDWPDGKFTVLQYGGRSQPQRGNRTDYDLVGSIAWPVLVMWGYSQNQTGSFEVRNEAQLSCVRASNATTTSLLGAPKAQSGVGGRSIPGVGVVVMYVGVALMGVLLL